MMVLMLHWTEKDSSRSGERGGGGEKQNYRELEDGSEDSADEVGKFLQHCNLSVFILYFSCQLSFDLLLFNLLSPHLCVFTSSQQYETESFNTKHP